ncbi:MAG: hypothetical protein KBF93_23660 [Leptospiraceae bacterium]|nr:hypothetical protein [Leptospiraceae bacterium]
MPIKPENKKLYPKNWKEISLYIRKERASGKCEFCGVENYSVGHWVEDKFFATNEAIRMNEMYGLNVYESIPENKDFVKVVLTVAHLDHNPSNCDYSNLRALCQRCHLRYDAKHHATTARQTRDKKYGIQYLFQS